MVSPPKHTHALFVYIFQKPSCVISNSSSKYNLLWSDCSSNTSNGSSEIFLMVLTITNTPQWVFHKFERYFSGFRCISSSSSITPLPLKSAYFNIFTFTWIRFFYFLRTYPIWIFTCKQVLSSCPHYWLEGQLSPNGTLIYSQVRIWQKYWCSVSKRSNFQQKLTLFRKSSLST